MLLFFPIFYVFVLGRLFFWLYSGDLKNIYKDALLEVYRENRDDR